jgi:hypothetical protein
MGCSESGGGAGAVGVEAAAAAPGSWERMRCDAMRFSSSG